MNMLAKTNGTAVGAPVARGTEGIDRDDLIMPRAKLLQSVSDEVKEDPRNFFPGGIINSLTKENLPEIFVPIFSFTQWMKFNPRNASDPNFDSTRDPGALIWQTNDPLDPRVKEAEFGPDGEKPVALKIINFVAYFPGIKMPIVLSFSKTSFKAGRQLASLVSFATDDNGNQLDAFARKYKLGTKSVNGPSGSYYVLTVAAAGKNEGDDYKFAEGMWERYHDKSKDIVVHDAGQDAAE